MTTESPKTVQEPLPPTATTTDSDHPDMEIINIQEVRHVVNGEFSLTIPNLDVQTRPWFKLLFAITISKIHSLAKNNFRSLPNNGNKSYFTNEREPCNDASSVTMLRLPYILSTGVYLSPQIPDK